MKCPHLHTRFETLTRHDGKVDGYCLDCGAPVVGNGWASAPFKYGCPVSVSDFSIARAGQTRTLVIEDRFKARIHRGAFE